MWDDSEHHIKNGPMGELLGHVGVLFVKMDESQGRRLLVHSHGDSARAVPRWAARPVNRPPALGTAPPGALRLGNVDLPMSLSAPSEEAHGPAAWRWESAIQWRSNQEGFSSVIIIRS